jgi:hypothetical protein
LRISTVVAGPSLAEVLAFAMIEAPEEVARVERAASNRMAAVRGWVGWRVGDVDISEDVDQLHRVTIQAEPVGPGYREPVIFNFLTSGRFIRRSERYDGFLRAIGGNADGNDPTSIVDRYFATRNNGRAASDFGPLTNALPQ